MTTTEPISEPETTPMDELIAKLRANPVIDPADEEIDAEPYDGLS